MPNGGLIGPRNVPSSAYKKGIWELQEQYQSEKNNTWKTITVTGGSSTVDSGGLTSRIFTATDNLVVSGGSLIADVLIVGAGGGGGFGHGGGGGGGAVLYRQNFTINPGTYLISVAAGTPGNQTDAANNQGSSTTAFGVTATGGGSGSNESGNDSSGRNGAGGNGANGGGGSYGSQAGGTGTAPTATGWTIYAGFAGGGGTNTAGNNYPTSGGGGSAQIGSTPASSTSNGGKGGDGIAISILPTTYNWAAGGGGVTYAGMTAGAGGLGGGGGGSSQGGTAGAGGTNGYNNGSAGTAGNDVAGGNAGANTGSGGGGGSNENGVGGNGGSGIVIIRYPNTSGFADGSSPDKAGVSASQIKAQTGTTTDGIYWIANPNINSGLPIRMWCDMSTDGGGWMLFACKVGTSFIPLNGTRTTDSFTNIAANTNGYIPDSSYTEIMWRFADKVGKPYITKWIKSAGTGTGLTAFNNFMLSPSGDIGGNDVKGGWRTSTNGGSSFSTTNMPNNFFLNQFSGISEDHGGSDRVLDLWGTVDGSGNNYFFNDGASSLGTKCIAGYCYTNEPVLFMWR